MCYKTKFKNIRAFSLLSVEIRHIMRYNIKNLKKKDLMEKANISDYTIRKLNRGDNVTTDVLVRICHAPDCHIEDIMEVLPEDKRG